MSYEQWFHDDPCYGIHDETACTCKLGEIKRLKSLLIEKEQQLASLATNTASALKSARQIIAELRLNRSDQVTQPGKEKM